MKYLNVPVCIGDAETLTKAVAYVSRALVRSSEFERYTTIARQSVLATKTFAFCVPSALSCEPDKN